MRPTLVIAAAALLLAAHAPARAQVPDLSPWDGVWMKVKVKQKGLAFHVSGPGVSPDNSTGSVYAQLRFDTGVGDRLALDVWVREEQWQTQTLTLLYLAGVADDALLVFNRVPVTPDPVVESIVHFGLALRLSGKLSGGTVTKGTLKSIGGYFVEVDDVPGSDQRFAGSVSLKGKVTTKLPPDLPL